MKVDPPVHRYPSAAMVFHTQAELRIGKKFHWGAGPLREAFVMRTIESANSCGLPAAERRSGRRAGAHLAAQLRDTLATHLGVVHA